MVKNYWTNTNIALLPTGKGDVDHVIWHPKIDRFGVRFSGGKPMSYVIMYFLGGRDRKLTLGKVSQITLDTAIEAAKAAFNKVSQGVDPSIERQTVRDVHAERFIDFVQPFLDAQQAKGLSDIWLTTQTAHLKGKTNKTTGEFTPAYFAELHNIPVKLIDRRMVSAELDRLSKERGQIAMTNARASLSKYFTWMISRHIAENNPVFGTEKIYPDQIDRTLSIDELVAVWHAADPSWQFGRIVRQLILTGARREQIGGLKHFELDLENAMITLPRKTSLRQRRRAAANGGEHKSRRGGSKNGERFEIPLSPQAVALFKLEPENNGEYVFGGKHQDNIGGFSNWSNGISTLYERIADQVKEHWTLHDLRRTFATLCVGELKLNPLAVDACINHKPEELKKGVRGIYQQANLLEEQTEVMKRWGIFIEKITAPTRPDLKIVSAA